MNKELDIAGFIVQDREVIGQFAYQFNTGRYSWFLYGEYPNHFYTDKEMLKIKMQKGWKYVSPSEVEITRKYIGR